ncbi:MAG: hypothetical protein OJF50_005668 [Nitrospira sp.]|nr:hypothetical protein [Nitrospira sp.]
MAEIGHFERVSAKLLEGLVTIKVPLFINSSATFHHFSSFPGFCQIG